MSADPLDPDDERRPGRPSLRVERITSVALALIDEEGPQALTLRSLAARLGSSTATLYRHLADRSTLIDTVIDAVFGEVRLSGVDSGPWDVALTTMATDLFEALERHRNIASLMLDGIPDGPNIVRIRRHVIAMLVEQGFTPDSAARTHASVGRYVLGCGLQTRIVRGPAAHLEGSADPTRSLQDEFRFGLAMMIAGLRVTQTAREDGVGMRPEEHLLPE